MEQVTKGSLKVGTKVMYRPNFGRNKAVEATIIGINKCKYKTFKIGAYEVDSIPFSKKDYAVVDYDNGLWGYGTYIECIIK